MNHKISRRAFVVALLASGASTAAIWYLNVEFFSLEARVIQIVERNLPHLVIAPGASEQFANDFIARTGPELHRQIEEVTARGDRDADGEREDRRIEEYVVSQFLMSSDFFVSGANPENPVGYRFYYSPYEYPCTNPFAVLS